MKYPVYVLLLLVLAYAAPASSQTKWFKYEGNPVLDVGPQGSWEGTTVHTGRVIYQDSLYRMWYSGFQGTRYWRMGYAISTDGVRWTKHDSNPVLDVTPGAWDGYAASQADVLRTGSNYEMWYTGLDSATHFCIGYASSPDGLHWRKAKSLNPVLDVGPPGSWDRGGLARPSVLGPDDVGGYKMWFGGTNMADGSIRIGYATGKDATSWTKRPDPVLTEGETGSWDGKLVFFPRVLYNQGTYEMWYGGVGKLVGRRIGYATSKDGIRWTRSPENPVLLPGPAGSWDGNAVLVGDILFDGRKYHMWYNGRNANEDIGVGLMGYAISPKGMRVSVSPTSAKVGSPVHMGVRVPDPAGLSFSAEIETQDGQPIDLIELLDDGAHGDSLAGDGVLANRWLPTEESSYVVDFKLMVRGKDNLRFELNDAGAFTSIGPIELEKVIFVNDLTPNPGDTVLVKLALRNHGSSARADAVSASLSTGNSLVTNMAALSPTYGNIRAGDVAVTTGYYPIFIDPQCRPGTDVSFDIAIAASGVPFWRDTFELRVLPPWWRTNWAYGFYLLSLIGLSGGTIWYAGTRTLKRRIERLEQERALERERARISQDMHDEVGARLTEIGILGELAKKDIHDPRKAEIQVQKISEASREVIANISEIIWAINSKNDSLDDLAAYLREYASKFLETTATQCTFDIPDVVPAFHLSAEARRNMFLVVKESLHNVVKHSGAADVRIRLSIDSQNIEITIEDSGRGFDTTQPFRFGNGLRNMQQRMSDIGGTFALSSKLNQGTTVAIAVRIGHAKRTD